MDLAARIANLSPAKRALLELALDEQISVGELSAAPLIPRQTRRAAGPLSFAQQRLWFLDRLHPGKADYNLPQLLRLSGPLNIVSLSKSLNAVIARHETLRTTFGKQGEEGEQRIAPELSLEVLLTDLIGRAAPEEEMQRLIDAELSRPFDLAEGPLLRATLFRLAQEEHALLIVLHHIVTDGWSMGIFNRELGVLYNAFCRGEPSPLKALPRQYLDYSVWQRQQHDGPAPHLAYWRRQLDGAPHTLELPTDSAHPAARTFRGGRCAIDLPPQTVAAVKSLAQRERATPFMVLLSVYQLLLHRYSGQDDILVGTPIAGRACPELEGLIGFFVNSLAMRARFAPDLSFRQLLGQVRETALGAFAHQDLPFEKLVEALAPRRDACRNPLFQAAFSLQSDPQELPRMEGLIVGNPELGAAQAKFDLTLFIGASGDGLRATFEYAADLFHEATIARMAGHYLTLLAAAAQDPDRPVARLPLLSDGECAQLARWGGNAADFPLSSSIQQLFEVQARATPEAVAISDGATRLSYELLNRRANQLARYLLKQGLTGGAAIGLCLERSAEAVTAILAILKAGGVYVPLDPTYPKERLALMSEDAGIDMLIGHSALRTSLPRHRAKLIELDRERTRIAEEDQDDPPPASDGDSAAYIMYTSGSTGAPKGVCVPHKAVNRLVKNAGYAALDAGQTFLLLAPLAFDASTFEIWGPLLNGGRCVVYPERLPTFDTLARAIRDHGVTTVWLTASLFNKVVDEAPQTLAGVAQLLTGGEALSADHVRRAQQALPDIRIINGYGPTENTTFTCCYPIPRPLDDTLVSVPIGRPVANTKVYVLDPQMQRVPIGVPGELYAGGAGLARGYVNRAQLTEERFVVDPYAPEEILYKTGDLVRYRTDGALEYLGRLDRQIKLRGFRIEPGEIETALRRHGLVKDCVVILREDLPGEKRLAAYVAAQSGRDIDPRELRRHLQLSLPEYMVPTAFVLMDELPLAANGKVDRGALPAPAVIAANGAGGGPLTILELHLIKIWEDVLNRKHIAVGDNFFELGGHSLLAVKLFDRIEKHFGKKLPLDALWFEGATIATLARLLDQDQESFAWPELVQIKAGDDMAPLFCVHTMGGNLFHYYELARSLSPRLPVYGLQARGVYGKHVPRDDVAAIASDCIAAMRLRQARGPYRLAGFSSGGIVAFEMAQQLRAAGDRVSCLALLDCYAPGITLKGGAWSRLRRWFTLKGLRQSQERLYHRVLQPLGLRRLRQMRTIGENHRWAHWNYQPASYPDRIDLFIAAKSGEEATDPLLGWSKIAWGELMVHSVPGTHGLMVKSPHVEILAEKLQYILDRALP